MGKSASKRKDRATMWKCGVESDALIRDLPACLEDGVPKSKGWHRWVGLIWRRATTNGMLRTCNRDDILTTRFMEK